ncbi:MAG TPA: MBOAT family O-acyltransferase [Candidatus Limnocylindrales bacterium]|nr:MBOAT family O-acyltransferase [Candidatus Limnocylindrales bacterium]
MLLYSFSFFVFFAVIFILFWKIPKKFQWVLLLFASYYFYGSWKPAYLGIIIVTTLVSYYCAIAIAKQKRYKGRYLFLALFVNLGFLFIFKYFNFFSITLNQLGNFSLPQFKILLPIGISFYTLQIIGYLVDVYKGKAQAETHIGHFALFAAFFPQLSAGPIERSTSLLPQLKKQHTFNYEQVASGARLFTLGLFKKMVIADNLSLVVDRVFSSLPDYKGVSLIIVIIFYTWQIYMDFSGYTDMARGVAKMIGINLTENFNLPYLATSIQDFWRRWHISFSSWLRDYVYFPLGGSRKGLLRTTINTLIVFILSGLWHGAAWTFVVWGILHGLGVSLERIMKKLFGTRVNIPNFLKVFYTYCTISIFWVFFRAPTISDALYILRNSFVGLKNFISVNYLWASIEHLFAFNTVEIVIVFGLLIIAIFLELLQSKISIIQLINRQPAFVRIATYAILIFLIIQLRNSQIKEFIYIYDFKICLDLYLKLFLWAFLHLSCHLALTLLIDVHIDWSINPQEIY